MAGGQEERRGDRLTPAGPLGAGRAAVGSSGSPARALESMAGPAASEERAGGPPPPPTSDQPELPPAKRARLDGAPHLTAGRPARLACRGGVYPVQLNRSRRDARL